MITYNAFVSACKKGKQPERAWEVFQAMQQQSLTQDVITYGALISAYEKTNQPERAWEVFQRACAIYSTWHIIKMLGENFKQTLTNKL